MRQPLASSVFPAHDGPATAMMYTLECTVWLEFSQFSTGRTQADTICSTAFFSFSFWARNDVPVYTPYEQEKNGRGRILPSPSC